MPGERELRRFEREHLEHIVATHNPNDPCQKAVRDAALATLEGRKEMSSYGILFLTNGARGYNAPLSFPEEK